MAQMRPPEEVLYAFSQWLQQWANYALSQAKLFAVSSNPDATAGGIEATNKLSESQEHQPPAHWLELVQSSPPAHWLVLFEEYGLEPPTVSAASGDVQADVSLPGSAPRLLQDWLDKFQRGLEQFAQQSVPIPPDPYPVEQDASVPIPAQFVPGKDLTADEVKLTILAVPSAQTLPPNPLTTRQEGSPASDQFSQFQGEGKSTALAGSTLHALNPGLSTTQSRDENKPAARAAAKNHATASDPPPIQQSQAPLTPSSLFVEQAEDRPLPSSIDEGPVGSPSSSHSPCISYSEHRTAPPSPQVQRECSQMSESVANAKSGTINMAAQSPQIGEAETKSAPGRLRLFPQPPITMPVPASSHLPDTGDSDQPAIIQPLQTVPHQILRLHVGVPTPAGTPLSAKPTPLIESIGKPPQSEPAHSLPSFAAPENTLPREKSAEADFLMETAPNSIRSPTRQGEATLISNLSLREKKEQSPVEWSQPAAAHWPELPERLPPIRPQSNFLADPTHRMRINREQRGRVWTA